jgi:hypothetical protein
MDRKVTIFLKEVIFMSKKNRKYDMIGFSNTKRSFVGGLIAVIGGIATFIGMMINLSTDRWKIVKPISYKDVDDLFGE